MHDLHQRFPKLKAMHDDSFQDEEPRWKWDEVLGQVEDEVERETLAWLRQVLETHPPLHLVVVSGQVTVEAPPAWRAAHPLVYAEALLMVCQHAAQSVRRHLLPRLAGR
jgi:hypothetical protein